MTLRPLTAAALAALVPLGSQVALAETCPSGSSCAAAGVAGDTASLLQADPTTRSGRTTGRSSGKKMKQAMPGSPEDDPNAHLCGIAGGFEKYDTYDKDLEVFGTVGVHAFTGVTEESSGVYISFDFVDADPDCSKGPGHGEGIEAETSCGVHIRSAASCSAAIGDALYSKERRKRDPWTCSSYTSEEIPIDMGEAGDEMGSDSLVAVERGDDGYFRASDTVIMYTGEGPSSVRGKVVIVYDYRGKAMACAPIVTHGLQAKSLVQPPPSLIAKRSTSLRPLVAKDFEKYFQSSTTLEVWGEVKVYEKMGSTPSLYGHLLQWYLEGVDPDCNQGPGGESPNSCGIHIHEGTSCGASAEGHFWKNGDRNKDPWHCVSYTAAVGDRVVKAIGQGVPAYTGLTSPEVMGHTMIVHDYSGARIACAVLQL